MAYNCVYYCYWCCVVYCRVYYVDFKFIVGKGKGRCLVMVGIVQFQVWDFIQQIDYFFYVCFIQGCFVFNVVEDFGEGIVDKDGNDSWWCFIGFQMVVIGS